jgi:hypothetical protein
MVAKYVWADETYDTLTGSITYLTGSSVLGFTWKEVWSENPGLVTASNWSFVGGFLRFWSPGIYRFTYNILFAGNSGANHKGWCKVGLYSGGGTPALVVGSEQQERMVTGGYTLINKSFIVRSAVSGADLKIFNGSTLTEYQLGISCNSNFGGNIVTRFSAATPYTSTLTIEALRSS